MDLKSLYYQLRFFLFYRRESFDVEHNFDLTFRSGLGWYSQDRYCPNCIKAVRGGGYNLYNKLGKETLIYSNESIKHGIISADIKLPKGQGIWSAFWTFGDNGMPEYDFEWCGQEDGVHCTAHWGYDYKKGMKKSTLHNYRKNKRFNANEFNNYSIELTPYKVIFRINGFVVRSIKRGVSTNEQHIIFSTGYGDYCGQGNGESVMEIRNIKVNKIL